MNHPILLKEEEKKDSVLELAQVRSSLVFEWKKTCKQPWLLSCGLQQSKRKLLMMGTSANQH